MKVIGNVSESLWMIPFVEAVLKTEPTIRGVTYGVIDDVTDGITRDKASRPTGFELGPSLTYGVAAVTKSITLLRNSLKLSVVG